MKNTRNITKDLFYIGANERTKTLFEAVYPIPLGVSYNSYFLNDDKTVLFNTVDKACQSEFFENLEYLLENKKLDYFVLNHLEPDHSALIKNVIDMYPQTKIVCNQKAKQMLFQFFDFTSDIENNFLLVNENDVINTGHHELVFINAPMVHWPEVMVTYDKTDKILFSADAFGTFGANFGNLLDNEITNFSEQISEYRRYYTNIVGKYGLQVNNLLNKAKNLDIDIICPLHGFVLKENVNLLLDKYSLWANYKPELKSTLIVYSSVYGSTKSAVDIMASKLASKGVKDIKIYNVSEIHHSYILSEAFKYSHIILATTTYNNDIFVKMKQFIQDMISHNLQNRTFALIENGSWACICGDCLRKTLELLKGTKFLEKKVSIKSSLKKSQEDEIDELVDIIVDDINN